MAISNQTNTNATMGSVYDLSTLTTLMSISTPSLISPSFVGGLSFQAQSPVTRIDLGSSTNLDFTIHGERPKHSKKFEEARDIFSTNLRLDASPAHYFHFLVWKELFGESFDDFGSVLKPGTGLFIAFASAVSRNQFDDWFEDYRKTFFKDQETGSIYLPEMIGGEVKGMHVTDFGRPAYGSHIYASIQQPDFQDWTWIAENCYHPVYRLKKGWFFANTTEAIHFKMRPISETPNT